ncbi:MAG TPA: glycosyltransferase family 2 protein, partial [Geobacteraceae bacterium]|nr:glycosyltransferase family 2 protein [Geobacteraceae bacterium]
MNDPLVTVCIPAYNCARFIADAIDSVLNQRFAGFELLIIDDCSTDSTAEIARSYAARDSRIIFKVNDKNLGMVANWNLCLETAQGKYIKYLFGDDLFSSNEALQRMASVLDNDSMISVVASGRNIIDAKSNFVKKVSSFADGTLVDGTYVISRCLSAQRNLVGEPSIVMFRKSQAMRGFNAEYGQLVDLEMWFHLLEQGKYAHIGESLSSFRVHPDQQSEKNVQNLLHIDEYFMLLKAYLDRPYVK